MENRALTGKESWQELKLRAEAKYNEVQRRRCDPENNAIAPVNQVDLYLLAEANFLVSLAEMERARG